MKLIKVANRLEIVPLNDKRKGMITYEELTNMFFIELMTPWEISHKLGVTYYAVNNFLTKVIAGGECHFKVPEIATKRESYTDLLIIEEENKLQNLIGI